MASSWFSIIYIINTTSGGVEMSVFLAVLKTTETSQVDIYEKKISGGTSPSTTIPPRFVNEPEMGFKKVGISLFYSINLFIFRKC